MMTMMRKVAAMIELVMMMETADNLPTNFLNRGKDK